MLLWFSSQMPVSCAFLPPGEKRPHQFYELPEILLVNSFSAQVSQNSIVCNPHSTVTVFTLSIFQNLIHLRTLSSHATFLSEASGFPPLVMLYFINIALIFIPHFIIIIYFLGISFVNCKQLEGLYMVQYCGFWSEFSKRLLNEL